jgi:stearoyl-CoA desaturase (delta-9 desaturase)
MIDGMFNPIIKNLKEIPNLILITIPMIFFGMFGIYDFFVNYENIKLVYFILGYILINIIGVTAGLHRYFSHRSFKAKKWKEWLMLYGATLAGQGSPVWWVSLHRGYHHKSSDTEKDPHSPIHGKIHSFILWMFRINPESISFKYSTDLLRNKDVIWFSSHYAKIWLLSNLFFILISWEFFLFFSMVPALVTLITYNITNCINHIPGAGYRNFQTKENSQNVFWLFPFVLGECWHNNHHGKPGASHFKKNWWEFDPAGVFIKIFKDRK